MASNRRWSAGLLFLSLVLAAADARAAVSVTQAELSGDRLRVEGQGAVPRATITIDGAASGTADAGGVFRLERTGFSSSTCRITVSDGSTSATATLSGCTVPPTPKPRFFLRTEQGPAGQPLRYQAWADGSIDLAFVFDWGDGTSLRDPETGFHPPVPPNNTHVVSATVTHAWAAPGAYSVTITAISRTGGTAQSDPITVTITQPASETQNDCGVAGDAGNTPDTAFPLILPATCSGHLDFPAGDNIDTYSFTVDQPFRLLTVRAVPPFEGVSLRLFDPTGATDASGNRIPEKDVPVFVKDRCKVEPCFSGGLPVTQNYEKTLAWTLAEAGTWIVELRGNVVDYTVSLHTGGGGDDCVQGRNPLTVPPPIDAPDNDFALRILENGEVNCTGTMPWADVDRFDLYGFSVRPGELVAYETEFLGTVGTVELFIQPPQELSPRQRFFAEAFQPQEIQGTFGILLPYQALPQTPNTDLNYALRVASSDPALYNGDCWSGGDGGDSFMTATPMKHACLGIIGGADADDWFSKRAEVGQEMFFVTKNRIPVVHDPDGLFRQVGGSIVIDKTGEWRIRMATDIGPPFAHYEGPYSVIAHLRQGVAGHDCGTGGDGPPGGLDVTLPIDCFADFLPFSQDPLRGDGDPSDPYNFHLTAGETVVYTVAVGQPDWMEYTVDLIAPSVRTVASNRFRGPRTFSFTADETGTWKVHVRRTPLTHPFVVWYSIAISKEQASAPVLSASIGSSQTTFWPGGSFQADSRVSNSGGPATNVTLTLSVSPPDAVRVVETAYDSFPDGSQPTTTVNLGNIPSPGTKTFTWGLQAQKKGQATITVTARDSTGVTANYSWVITIQK